MSHEFQDTAKHARKRPLWTPGPATTPVTYGTAAIHKLVRHRAPFLFVDEVNWLDLEQRTARGRYTIAPSDPLFAGHFPGAPLYPGVLQIEVMGQLALCLRHFVQKGSVVLDDGDTPRDVRGLVVHHAQFLSPIHPGAQLDILAQVLAMDEYTLCCSGQLLVRETIASFAIMEVYLVDE